MDTVLKQTMTRLVTRPIRWGCPLNGYTSFAVGGPAQAVVTVSDEQELQGLLVVLAQHETPWQVIGRGTNLLVSDAGYNGVVILMGNGFRRVVLQDASEQTVVMRTGSACTLSRLSGLCIRKGWTGLEFACGIPGSVGGAVIMNAGAWGGEMADVLTAVEVVTATGTSRLQRSQLHFGYRCWLDHRENTGQVVTAVEFGLEKEAPEVIRKRCAEMLKKRREKQPRGLPNAGSFFKNPMGESAGRLIEQCGCKGMRVGGAMVSPVHANFLVNTGGATAADIKKLMDLVQKKVQKESGVFLEPEVRFL